jgi:hypothetical protein
MTTRNLTDRVLETLDGHTQVETPICSFCGNTGSITLTNDELADLEAGAAIQDAAGRLPRATREQFISGIHPDCWDSLFGDLEA